VEIMETEENLLRAYVRDLRRLMSKARSLPPNVVATRGIEYYDEILFHHPWLAEDVEERPLRFPGRAPANVYVAGKFLDDGITHLAAVGVRSTDLDGNMHLSYVMATHTKLSMQNLFHQNN
jgi:hypothetical protein